jgi:hypothetical protein
MPATGGLFLAGDRSLVTPLQSPTRFSAVCLCVKNSDSWESETGSTETRFDIESERGAEAENTPLARPFGRQIGEAGHAHAVGKPAVDGGLDDIGSKEGK